MKMSFKILLVALSIGFISCEKTIEKALDRFTMFEVDNESSFTIASTTVLNTPFALSTPEIQSDSNNDFENNNSRKNLIESAKLKKLNLSIQSPDTGNFDFLNEIELFINAEGLPEALLASKKEIPENGSRTLALDTEVDTEFAEYLKKDGYNIRVRALTDKTINEDYEVKVNTVFFIDAKILGI